MSRLPHYGGPITIPDVEYDVYCKKEIELGEINVITGLYEYKFYEGEKYNLRIIKYKNTEYCKILPKDNRSGDDVEECNFSPNNGSDRYIWNYFETKTERRKRILNEICQ